MSIAVVVSAHLDLKSILPWTAKFARTIDESLLILQYQQSTSLPETTSGKSNDTQVETLEQRVISLIRESGQECNISRDLDDSPSEEGSLVVTVKTFRCPDPENSLLDELTSAKPTLVLLPRHYATKLRSPEFAVERHLFQQSCSAAMQIRLPLPEPAQFKRILVTTGSEQSSRFALRQAVKIAQKTNGEVDAIYIQPDVGPLAENVGQERIEAIVNRTLEKPAECVNRRVLITKDISKGFQSIRSMDHDLILVGAEYHSVIERKMFSNVAEQLLMEPEGPPVAVVRPAMPIQDQLRTRMEQLLQRYVPQLDRSRRVELVEKIQLSSEWDIDFIALIVLSTLIAALGLIQNSTAVVIGAMLVAPLMTPLLGSGLSIIQGNKLLARKAAKTVLFGFVTAYFLGVILGLLVPGMEISAEMTARGSPGLPDIVIAFLSGMAAVYAMGRPHLTSALPGVAIAASLVPPIATSGLATSLGVVPIATGSALLFLTNIVAIILGAAAAWWVIGFRDAHEYGGFGTWGPRVATGLMLFALCLGIYESWPSTNLEKQLTTAIETKLEETSDVMLLSVKVVEFHHENTIRITMGTPTGPTTEINRLIESAVRQTSEEPYPIQIDWHIVWNSVPAKTPETNQ